MARSSATAANTLISVTWNAARRAGPANTSSIVRVRAIGSPPVAARSSRSIGPFMKRGSMSVRTTQVSGNSRLFRAVMASETCASGT